MRLSHGFVRGESLSCIYHGWRYGPDGACQHIPAHPGLVPPASINCGPRVVAERNGVVWAAAVQPSSEPPEIPGYEALRSLVVAGDVASFAQRGAPAGEGIKIQLGSQRALLLVEPQGAEVLVIALVDPGLSLSDRLAASAALETLRRDVEASEVAA